MIETFISKSGQGKTGCMLIEAAKQTGKNVAFISLEMPAGEIMRRLKCINPTTNSFKVFTPRGDNKNLNEWLIEKLNSLSDEFDIICIDGVDCCASSKYSIFKKEDFEKINHVCFKNSMSPCESLWVSKSFYQKLEFDNDYILNPKSIESFEIEGLIKVKQVCRRFEHSLLPEVNLIEAIDLITKEVKTYNFSNIFKNKNL